MKAHSFRFVRCGLMALAGALAACASTTSEDAGAVLARASQAMGAERLSTLRYVGDGTGYSFGQAYKAEGAWPKITLHSLTRSIDYGSGTMRDEVVLSRAEPLGGGGYPLSGQQRTDQFISGEIAWNVAGGNVAPGPRFVNDRLHQLWITPHGVLKAAMRGGASVQRGATGGSALSFRYPERFTATAHVGADGLVTRVESTFPDPVMGDTTTVTHYDDYHDFGGIKFPTRVRQTMGGYPVLDLAIKEVQPNAPVSLPLPDAARNQGERVTSEKVADGVWFVAGGSHHSVAIEMQDHLILVETPLNDARTQAAIDHVKGLVPGKPIRVVVNTHQHFDHAGGVRAAVAEGATIVTHADNVPFFQRAFAQANGIRPDLMARAGKSPRFRAVTDKLDHPAGDPRARCRRGRIGADGIEGAMRHVEDAHHAEDQRQPDGDEEEPRRIHKLQIRSGSPKNRSCVSRRHAGQVGRQTTKRRSTPERVH